MSFRTIYIYIYIVMHGGTHGAMLTVVGNGHGDPSLNLE